MLWKETTNEYNFNKSCIDDYCFFFSTKFGCVIRILANETFFVEQLIEKE